MVAAWIAATGLAHITLNPNMGAESGGYFHTTMRVPHGAANLHTTELHINIPYGILVAKPEVPEDWTASIRKRTLSGEEEYLSHGRQVTEAPEEIVLVANSHADGVHNDHLLNIDMQLKVGCIFQDEASNTLWNDEYTLWWVVTQVCEDATGEVTELVWNGTQSDVGDVSPAWTALPANTLPAPYLYIESGPRCASDYVGSTFSGGLMWFGAHVAAASSITTTSINIIQYMTLTLSIIGVILGSFASLLWITVVCLRFQNKKKFTEHLVGVDYRAQCEIPQS
tara:strand:- start:5023 stop:5868 length:846 start_codon:yes stop_codon:yes gene_type:complete